MGHSSVVWLTWKLLIASNSVTYFLCHWHLTLVSTTMYRVFSSLKLSWTEAWLTTHLDASLQSTLRSSSACDIFDWLNIQRIHQILKDAAHLQGESPKEFVQIEVIASINHIWPVILLAFTRTVWTTQMPEQCCVLITWYLFHADIITS